MGADWKKACTALGAVRSQLGRDLKLAKADEFHFSWIVDFPMFEWNEEDKKWDPAHHMFTMPQEKYLSSLESDPGSVKGDLYDLVCNGVELASGSIRVHDPELQSRIFKVVGMDEEEAQRRFGFLLEAFRYGPPPHGGIAPGLDRLVTLMAGESSIREVIAFPKNTLGQSPDGRLPGGGRRRSSWRTCTSAWSTRRSSRGPAAVGTARSASPPSPTAETSHRLLAWFFAHRRELPWREESDPYRIWVSEVMLQQTRAQTVAAPTTAASWSASPISAALAAADEQEVLKAWEGLGYYGRARGLLEAAREIVRRHSGRFPSDPQAALALPGVGPYTAAAVLSIAFARPLAVVDGNVLRVVTRLTADDGDPATAAVRGRVRAYVEKSFHSYHPGWVNQAWMELGALVCRPAPDCPACPLAFACRALREGRTAELPARRRRAPLPVRRGSLFLLLPREQVEAGNLRAPLEAAWAEAPAGKAFGELLRARELPLLAVRRALDGPARRAMGAAVRAGRRRKGHSAPQYGVELIGTAGPALRHSLLAFPGAPGPGARHPGSRGGAARPGPSSAGWRPPGGASTRARARAIRALRPAGPGRDNKEGHAS